jgi:hypothetical protein
MRQRFCGEHTFYEMCIGLDGEAELLSEWGKRLLRTGVGT